MASLFNPLANPAANPMGTDGFEFVEYTAPDPDALRALFERMGFPVVARHRSKNVTLHSQGDINFVINAEPDSFGQRFAQAHGPSVCAMGFRVQDAAAAFERAVALGAEPHRSSVGPMELNIPAIVGIGGSLIYFVDRYGERSIYDVDFKPVAVQPLERAGLVTIDHLTHNVHRGNMDKWTAFYANLFNFREIRYFDIEGKKTGLFSRALTSPCGKIRIPINESQDDKSQIEEYLREYRGEGIQHIALSTDDIYRTVDVLRARDVAFQDTPDTYYEGIAARVTGHREIVAELQKRRILIDGSGAADEGILLQIFTTNVIGPIFFEIIQRKGNQGFGEGNFKALFESIELDQIPPGCYLNLELYSYWRSSASYRVRIALNLKALPYVTHAVDLTKDGGEQWQARYRSVNPQSRVPTLVHDGQRFTQSLAIIEYLDETFPGTRLIPKDPVDRARVRMLSQIIASDIQPLQNTSTTRYLKEKLNIDDAAVTTWLREWITRGLDAFNTHIEHEPAHGRFSHGDTPTMADCCLVPQLYVAQRFGIEPTRFPRLTLIGENCAGLAAFQHAHPAKQPDAH